MMMDIRKVGNVRKLQRTVYMMFMSQVNLKEVISLSLILLLESLMFLNDFRYMLHVHIHLL